MVIKYNLDNRNYYLRDLGDGSGTFVRLDVPLVILSMASKLYLGLEAWLHHIVRRLSHGCLVLLRQHDAQRLITPSRGNLEDLAKVPGWSQDWLNIYLQRKLGKYQDRPNDKLRHQIWWQLAVSAAVLVSIPNYHLASPSRKETGSSRMETAPNLAPTAPGFLLTNSLKYTTRWFSKLGRPYSAPT